MSSQMKNFLIANALVALAVTSVTPVRSQEATAPAPAEFKVAIIDVSRLVTDSVAGKQVLATLQEMGDSMSADLKVLADELKGIEGQISEGRLSLSETRISELQRELEDKSIAFRRARDDADKRLKDLQGQNFVEIERLVMPIITQIGQESGYTMIFNKFESGLVYAQESVDITDMILRAFDASTASQQSGAPAGGATDGGATDGGEGDGS